MKIEVLFPEICNLYGDLANLRYLKLCLPEAEVLETTLRSKPRFLDGDTDLVYMGTTTEEGQRLVLEQLMFYRGEILDSIQAGQRFLITGNAMELFGERIEEDGEEVLRGLGAFPGVARRSSINRFNSLFVGEFPAKATPAAAEKPSEAADTESAPQSDAGEGRPEPITVVGFKSQFGHMFSDEGDQGLDHLALFRAVRGPGLNRFAAGEGIRINNFLATYVIGPLLILNPPLTGWLIRDFLGQPLEKLAFEEAAMDSYVNRVNEYTDPDTGLYYWGGTTERW